MQVNQLFNLTIYVHCMLQLMPCHWITITVIYRFWFLASFHFELQCIICCRSRNLYICDLKWFCVDFILSLKKPIMIVLVLNSQWFRTTSHSLKKFHCKFDFVGIPVCYQKINDILFPKNFCALAVYKIYICWPLLH